MDIKVAILIGGGVVVTFGAIIKLGKPFKKQKDLEIEVIRPPILCADELLKWHKENDPKGKSKNYLMYVVKNRENGISSQFVDRLRQIAPEMFDAIINEGDSLIQVLIDSGGKMQNCRVIVPGEISEKLEDCLEKSEFFLKEGQLVEFVDIGEQ
jgi:hypothetical protein